MKEILKVPEYIEILYKCDSCNYSGISSVYQDEVYGKMEEISDIFSLHNELNHEGLADLKMNFKHI